MRDGLWIKSSSHSMYTHTVLQRRLRGTSEKERPFTRWFDMLRDLSPVRHSSSSLCTVLFAEKEFHCTLSSTDRVATGLAVVSEQVGRAATFRRVVKSTTFTAPVSKTQNEREKVNVYCVCAELVVWLLCGHQSLSFPLLQHYSTRGVE